MKESYDVLLYLIKIAAWEKEANGRRVPLLFQMYNYYLFLQS